MVYSKNIRSIWLDDSADTYLPIEPSDLQNVSVTAGGAAVTEYLDWLKSNAVYSVTPNQEYTRVTITAAQYSYVQLRWNGIRYATDKWVELPQ